MSRFLDQKTIKVGGNLTVMTMPGLSSEELQALAGRAGETLTASRNWLLDVIQQLKAEQIADAVDALAKKYLMTSANDLFIRRILVMTLNGLSGDQYLKIGNRINPNKVGVVGSVSQYTDGRDRTKPHHTKAKDLETGTTCVYGAIKLEQANFNGEKGIHTLIHEATHKYAGTIDYAYFDERGENPTPSFGKSEQAKINADSYAWFVQRVYKKDYPRGYR